MTEDPLITRLIASANHVFPLCSASDHFNWRLSHRALISGRLKAGAAGKGRSTVEGGAKHGKTSVRLPDIAESENCGVSSRAAIMKLLWVCLKVKVHLILNLQA